GPHEKRHYPEIIMSKDQDKGTVAAAEDARGGQLRELQVEWLDKSRAYVRDNPVKALGIAVVGGFLLSRLLSSR
ncbi:MAG: DUF883 C-terminal domain-containing protein, partial [Chromatiaceae bacterium]